MDEKIGHEKLKAEVRKLKFPIPFTCLACGGECFAINGFKVRKDSKFGDDIIGVLLYCNGKCKRFVAECLGGSTTWYVSKEDK